MKLPNKIELGSIHFPMFVYTLSLTIIGILFIYSTTHNAQKSGLFLRQIIWLFLGLAAMFLLSKIDYHHLVRISHVFYIILVISLLLLTIVGRLMGGARSWFFLKWIALQPSELGKIVLILFISKIMANLDKPQLYFKDIIKSITLLSIPVVLIIAQPDMGTALTYIPIFIGIVYAARLRLRVIVFLVILGLILISGSWFFVLKPYQKERITTFVAPEKHKKGAGYQIYQSKIAIGSGGLLGKGYLKGTQSQLNFVPEQHTDFIFSVLAEETGLAGVSITLSLYLLLLLSILQTALLARDRAGLFIAIGFLSLLSFHFFINVGMVVGLMPTTGIPLPLISYGGSSLLTTFAGLGVMMNIRSRRFVNI